MTGAFSKIPTLSWPGCLTPHRLTLSTRNVQRLRTLSFKRQPGREHVVYPQAASTNHRQVKEQHALKEESNQSSGESKFLERVECFASCIPTSLRSGGLTAGLYRYWHTAMHHDRRCFIHFLRKQREHLLRRRVPLYF